MAAQHEIGSMLAARFRVEALAGAGGMSAVYRAHDEQLGRTVAVKVFSTIVAEGTDGRRRASEVRLLAGLDHPALVTLFDVVDSDEGTLVVMQYVDGEDLGRRLDRGPVAADELARIGSALSAALSTVHARDIIHRDIKPANILIPKDLTYGSPPALLADFGIARLIDDTTLTAVGTIIGTAQYLSPEQARGHTLTTASDIYSLGLVLLESLTGTRTFAGSGVEAAVARIARDPIVPSTLPRPWQSLLREMTARDPAARPTASEVSARLATIAENPVLAAASTGEPDATMPLTAAYAPTQRLEVAAEGGTTEALAATPPARRGRRPLAIAAGVVIALAIGAVVTTTALGSADQAEVAPTPSITSVAPTPTPTATTVVAPVPDPTPEDVTPVDEKGPPGKGKPCKGNGKKKDC